MEGVVILHEIIHELHSKKFNGYFEKIYKRSKMVFSLANSKNYGIKWLSRKWCAWIEKFASEEVWASKLTMTLATTSKKKV
jgi:hypothetical protein